MKEPLSPSSSAPFSFPLFIPYLQLSKHVYRPMWAGTEHCLQQPVPLGSHMGKKTTLEVDLATLVKPSDGPTSGQNFDILIRGGGGGGGVLQNNQFCSPSATGMINFIVCDCC